MRKGRRNIEAELADRNPCFRLHHGGPQGAKPKPQVIAKILAVIRDAVSVKHGLVENNY
jgi:hypothetical protein